LVGDGETLGETLGDGETVGGALLVLADVGTVTCEFEVDGPFVVGVPLSRLKM
jgi:hypothetical protein